MTAHYYGENALIHADRRLAVAKSDWQRSFSCENLRPLIICRGPVRKEAMEVFNEMGIDNYGMLLSEKDSIIYEQTLAPELRLLRDTRRVHRLPDYGGATGEERLERIAEIIDIAKAHGYCSVFAGYGFMAEDYEMVAAVENAGLRFIGPGSHVVRSAGFKDEAKRIAKLSQVSVTPGIDNITALTLLRKYPDKASLRTLAKKCQFDIDWQEADEETETLDSWARALVEAARQKGMELFTIEEMGLETQRQIKALFERWPDNRFRLKAAGGGGGKGQRILNPPATFSGNKKDRMNAALKPVPSLVRDILNEVKATAATDNRSILIELNIESSRHMEIQVVGNGRWCVTMGGRDCSLQMHEQKLLELSVTDETLEREIAAARAAKKPKEVDMLQRERQALAEMEAEAQRFGSAVGLNSVSTFECIVTEREHYFMEMNTRIQVEHRVTELCRGLKFVNPDNPKDSFEVNSLVEMMVLLAAHGERLPPPLQSEREGSAAEVRLNATNDALMPHAGGLVNRWSSPLASEIRDDQGICIPNPDTGAFMRYRLAGSYDSNIALLVTTGSMRRDNLENMAEILRCSEIEGEDLATNLEFHRGLISWLLANNPNARASTDFVQSYLSACGQLIEATELLDLDDTWRKLCAQLETEAEDAEQLKAVLQAKQELLLRPIRKILQHPHLLSGWISESRSQYLHRSKKLLALENPLKVLQALYHYLGMDYVADKPAAACIWQQDLTILESGLDFYTELEQRLKTSAYKQLNQRLADSSPPKGIKKGLWNNIKASHRGFQAGCEILSLLPALGYDSGFNALSVDSRLLEKVPATLRDTEFRKAMRDRLAPPPPASADEIVAVSGGMIYSSEAPGLPPLLETGDHFEVGDTVCIIEVMKMFNRQSATFSGTVEKILFEGNGTVVRKGQPLFKVKPDKSPDTEVDLHAAAAERKRYTKNLMKYFSIPAS